ncbi:MULTISPECIES: ATP-binding protein [Deefgea]|uniref:histidine kinase n=1 Tax=Deefgea chitinilytica TaxID=570276 RepID=A0ABS2CFC8_9NEIS|nr:MULTISPECIES: ATP-binding protein [Deefgea]MBM5572846.1 histidine kinase [Deefgea chitinilytica]MBM9890083.1 histidine kinase [Deefgea sp. CFH1-16]
MNRLKKLSIRSRLHLGVSAVLLAFFCVTGFAVQNIYRQHLQDSHFTRLQSAVYLLIAMTELNPQGQLILPKQLAEPLFSIPNSGLYAFIDNPAQTEKWASPSAAQLQQLPALNLSTGVWQQDALRIGQRDFLQTAYQVRWLAGQTAQTIRFRVLEDQQYVQAQLAQFQRALWGGLAAAAVCLLLAQALILRWGLTPLRRLEVELAAIEGGEQAEVTGEYPRELAPLAGRLNRLVEQERARQQRYREALADLAHSLKTPLAILRSEQSGDDYAQRVNEQVTRMDHIVQHQLNRAALRGSVELAAAIALKPIAERVLAAMQKVYAGRGLTFTLDCADDVAWPLDEGDAFEVLGNLLDNAGKFARLHVTLSLSRDDGGLLMIVADDGPGFGDEPVRALQRGIRLDEHTDKPGQGIGLAVVADIVDAYGGTIQLGRSTLNGAEVRIVFSKGV